MIGGWRDRPGRFLVWRSSSAVVRPRGRKATRLRGVDGERVYCFLASLLILSMMVSHVFVASHSS